MYADAREFAERRRAGIGALLAEAARDGELSCPDLDELAQALLVAYNGTMITWALEPRGELSARIRAGLAFLLAPYRRPVGETPYAELTS